MCSLSCRCVWCLCITTRRAHLFAGLELHRKQNQTLQRLCVSPLIILRMFVTFKLKTSLVTATKKANLSSPVKNWFKLLSLTCPSKDTIFAQKRCGPTKQKALFGSFLLIMIQVYISLMTRKVIDAIKDPSTLDDKDYYGNKRSFVYRTRVDCKQPITVE